MKNPVLRSLEFLLTTAAIQHPESAAEIKGMLAEITQLEQPAEHPQQHPAGPRTIVNPHAK